VQESRFAGPFLDPVQWEELELWDYPWIVTKPMDLSTVHNKLVNREYVTPEAFAADVRLVFTNATMFNKPDDFVHANAHKLLQSFDSQLAALALIAPAVKAVGGGIIASKALTKKKPMFNKVKFCSIVLADSVSS